MNHLRTPLAATLAIACTCVLWSTGCSESTSNAPALSQTGGAIGSGSGGAGPAASGGSTATGGFLAGTGGSGLGSGGQATGTGGSELGSGGHATATGGAARTTGGVNGDSGGLHTGSGGTLGGPHVRVDNPFADAQGYVNPEWKAKAMAEPGGGRVADIATAVWIDRIAAIHGTEQSQSNGPMGVRDHLDAALVQGADYIQFVIYNLPGRDCSALASNGELGQDELPRYKSEYIDEIAAIMADEKYAPLRIVNIIEVDSLPNLITNLDVPKCVTMKDNGGYVQGVAYALKTLGALSNTYNYVDAAHHGWLGWDTNLTPAAEMFVEVGQLAGMQTVQGFITNSANYSALREEFLDANAQIGGQPLRQATWIDWNNYLDELTYAQALRDKLISLGFSSDIGMLIDTSRNGWGGSARPSGPGSQTDVDGFVNASRIDRRIHAGNWCNQAGAGMGERPRADPEPGIDAYVWVKPPGESDGSSRLIENNDGKLFDRMCDPTYGGNARNGDSATGALPDAPISGAWFSAQFQELMRNAHPPL